MELKSTKLLFLYRSFLFRFVRFETNDDKLENITAALNIKRRKQRIEFVYDEAIKYINQYYKDDLCQFKDNQCIVQRKNKSDKVNGCCRLCQYQNNKACEVNNLSCKLFYCETALKNVRKLNIDDIDILKVLNKRQRFILKSDYFTKRENVIKDLQQGIIITTVKVVYRLMKLLLYKNNQLKR